MPADTMIGRYLAAREGAAARGDINLCAEIDHQLGRLGFRPDAGPGHLERAEQAADEAARPAGQASTRRARRSAATGE